MEDRTDDSTPVEERIDLFAPASGRSRGRERVRALVAVSLAVALIAGVAAVFVTGVGEEVPARTTVAPTTSVPPTTAAGPADEAALDAAVAELSRYVERVRGLKFKQPVEAELLDDAAFRERFRPLQEEGRDPEEIEDTKDVFVALGLLDRDVDLQAAVDELLAGAVAGFYDHRTDELVVRGADLGPAVRSTLVHELVHALQDQHFDIDRDELDDLDDEQATAFEGLVEGDASYVQQRWLSEQSAADQAAAQRSDRAQLEKLGDIPEIVVTFLTFPYIVGPRFVEALVEQGGTARVDQAFTSPPTTSEHLLHPERFLRGERTVDVPQPPAGGEVFDKGAFGELALLLTLAEGAGDDDVAAAQRAADGWGGDAYAAWREGERTCVRSTFAMDTARDASELRTVALDWAKRGDGRTVEGTERVTVTACA